MESSVWVRALRKNKDNLLKLLNMQCVSSSVNWRKNVKCEPKCTRIIAVHFELLVHSSIVMQGLLYSTKDHCLHVISTHHDQDEAFMS